MGYINRSRSYRATSIAPALQEELQGVEGSDRDAVKFGLFTDDGDDENESKYNAIKKSSFSAHTVKRTFYIYC